MRPSGTEPFSDHSFSTTPTQLFGMNRSVSQAKKASATARTITTTPVTPKVVSREVNMDRPPIKCARMLAHFGIWASSVPAADEDCPFNLWTGGTYRRSADEVS